MERRASLTELYLHTIPLGVVINKKTKWSQINIEDTVEKALQTLCREGRSVLPVWNEKTKEYQYCCSRLDIISMIAWSKDMDWRQSPLKDILETEEHIVDPRIWKYSVVDSVIDLMEPLSKGVHHLLVENENSEDDEDPFYFVSQMDILTFLYNNKNRLSAMVDAPINKIGLLQNTVDSLHCVPSTMLAKDAFKKFIVYKCDCLGIVDAKTGQLLSHVTEIDILGMGPEAMQFLLKDEYLTILDFVSAIRKENKKSSKPVTCTKDSLMKQVIETLVTNYAYHIFVIDEKDVPVCLLTLSDVICKFSPYDYKDNKISKRLTMMQQGSQHDIEACILEATIEEEMETDEDDDNDDEVDVDIDVDKNANDEKKQDGDDISLDDLDELDQLIGSLSKTDLNEYAT